MRGVREVDGAGRKGERGRGEGRERAAGGGQRASDRGSEGAREGETNGRRTREEECGSGGGSLDWAAGDFSARTSQTDRA